MDDITIGIKTTADTSGVEAATTGFAGQTAALDRMKAAADAAAEKIRNLDSSNAVLAPGLQDVAEKAEAAEKAISDADEAVTNHGASSQMAASKIQMMGQTATGLAVGLSALADVARNNGQGELADDLSKVAGAMSLVGNLAAGGLQMHQVIAAAGGLQAAIIALRTTAVAAMATMWPYFAAIAAGAAAYYAAKEAADAMMGTVEEMDAKLERASVSIGGVTLSLAEEKEARDQAKEAIDGYRNSLSGANDELERNIELAGNQEQIEKARINADIRKRQAEIDAQSAAFTRTGGREGLSPEQAIVESQRLEEEKIKRINQAEEQQRRAEEQALQKAAENRRKDLQEMQGDNADNNAEIDGATGRYSLSKADRQALIEKGRAVETARQKYGADSAEVEAAMQEYTAAAVAMNEEERADLLRRLTLREALSKNIEAAAADLEALEQKLDKTLRDNQKEREISEIESDGQVGSSRTRSVTQIENERARQNEARQREAMAAGDRARAALRDRAEAARSGASALGKDGNAAVQAFGNDIAGALKDKELDDAELSKLSPQIRAALSSSNDTVRILAETVLEIAREQKLLQERLRNRA